MTNNNPNEAQKHIDNMSSSTLLMTLRAMKKRFPLDPEERIYGIDMHEWHDLLHQEADRRMLLDQFGNPPKGHADDPHDHPSFQQSKFIPTPDESELLEAWNQCL